MARSRQVDLTKYHDKTGELRRQLTHADMPSPEETAKFEKALKRLPLSESDRKQLHGMNALEMIELFSIIPLAELSNAGVLRDQNGFYLVNKVALASGGFGGVFRGYSSVFHRSVAMKTPLKNTVEAREALKREGQAQANETHPNIITVFSYIPLAESTVPELNDKPVLVMEYLDPQTSTRLDNIKDVNPLEVISLAEQLCNAIAHLDKPHAARLRRARTKWDVKDEGSSLLHLDIKPSNAMVTNDGVVKLGDFGIASSVRDFSNPNEGNAGSVDWVSPERVHNTVEGAEMIALNIQTELFSLTSVVYYMITGVSYFKTNSATETLLMILNKNFVMTDELRAYCKKHNLDERAVQRFFAIAWAKKKEDRFANIDSYLNALRATFRPFDAARRLPKN